MIISFKLPEEELILIDKIAEEEFRSRSNVLKMAVSDFLSRREEAQQNERRN